MSSGCISHISRQLNSHNIYWGKIFVWNKIVAETNILKSLISEELHPGATAVTDEQLLDAGRNLAQSIYHPTSTCKMGPASDPMAVVDERLRIHGLNRIRVVDASIMPTLVSGNTNAPTIMIAEKAAEMILEDHN